MKELKNSDQSDKEDKKIPSVASGSASAGEIQKEKIKSEKKTKSPVHKEQQVKDEQNDAAIMGNNDYDAIVAKILKDTGKSDGENN